MWLTDYVVAQNLQTAYDDQTASNGNVPPPVDENSGATPLSPEVKAMIAADVRRQILNEQAAAARPPAQATPAGPDANLLPPALDPNQRIFVVSASVDMEVPSSGQARALTPGDIIERTGSDLTTDGRVPVRVLSSKAGSCPADSASTMDIATLQDMLNQFREQITAGMNSLANQEGKGGLPAGPAADPRLTAEGQVAPDASVEALLGEQLQQADQAEQQVTQASAGGM